MLEKLKIAKWENLENYKTIRKIEKLLIIQWMYHNIIYDVMPIFDSDSTSFGGSLIVINGDYDEIGQVDSLISIDILFKIQFSNIYLGKSFLF